MDRGRKLVAMAKRMPYNTNKRTSAISPERSCEKEIYICEDGTVFKSLPNETASSFDVGISENMLAQFAYLRDEKPRSSSSESEEEDEDIFHETDYDDSDYIPTDESILNSTSESVTAMALVLESNINDWDPQQNDESQVLETPTSSSSFKKMRKINKNCGKEYVTYKNKIVPAKETEKLKECKQKCYEKINLEQQ